MLFLLPKDAAARVFLTTLGFCSHDTILHFYNEADARIDDKKRVKEKRNNNSAYQTISIEAHRSQRNKEVRRFRRQWIEDGFDQEPGGVDCDWNDAVSFRSVDASNIATNGHTAENDCNRVRPVNKEENNRYNQVKGGTNDDSATEITETPAALGSLLRFVLVRWRRHIVPAEAKATDQVFPCIRITHNSTLVTKLNTSLAVVLDASQKNGSSRERAESSLHIN